MNFECIECLHRKDIEYLYNNILENEFISSTYLYVRCSNGRYGYYTWTGYHGSGFYNCCYGGPQCLSVQHVCGSGRHGCEYAN